MKNILIYLSFLFSVISTSLATYLMYDDYRERRIFIKALDPYAMSKAKADEFLSLSGYFIKRGVVFELHQSEVSATFRGASGFARMTVVHPPENIKVECLNSWVNISGIGRYSSWGDTIDFIHGITNLKEGGSCMKNPNLRVNYIDVLNEEIRKITEDVNKVNAP